MDEKLIEDYVRSAVLLAGYSFDAERVALVTAEFRRIAAIAAEFSDEALPLELEPLAQFRP